MCVLLADSYIISNIMSFFFFFFQAEDGIRDADVTGVQTCALPISVRCAWPRHRRDRLPAGPIASRADPRAPPRERTPRARRGSAPPASRQRGLREPARTGR